MRDATRRLCWCQTEALETTLKSNGELWKNSCGEIIQSVLQSQLVACRLEWRGKPWTRVMRSEALPVRLATDIKACAQEWTHKWKSERNAQGTKCGLKEKRSSHWGLRFLPNTEECFLITNLPSHMSHLALWLKKSRTHSTLWLEGISQISERSHWESANLNIISKTRHQAD